MFNEEARHKRVHTIWFPFISSPGRAKLNYGSRNQKVFVSGGVVVEMDKRGIRKLSRMTDLLYLRPVYAIITYYKNNACKSDTNLNENFISINNIFSKRKIYRNKMWKVLKFLFPGCLPV